MGKLNSLILLLLLVGCSGKINHNIKGLENTKVTVGPDFKSAASFCDDRYGEKTEEAEKCFSDYRNFYTLRLKLDMDSIAAYCEQWYAASEPSKMDSCVDDLKDILTNMASLRKL